MIDQVCPSPLRTIVLTKRANQSTFGLYLANDIPQGIYIVTIEANSPAAEAKIRPGDRLLAVNGQLVRLMIKNPKETVLQIAQYARSLTVTIEASDLLDYLEVLLSSDNYKPSLINNRTIFVEPDFERYVKSLMTEDISYLIDDDADHHRKRRRRRQRLQKSIQTQTEIPFEDNHHDTSSALLSSPQRSIPSMGTHAMLRRSNSASKGQLNETSNLDQVKNDGTRKIYLNRSKDYQGFGFHVDSKSRQHIVHQIEPNSPAARSDLRVNDIILQVNEQSTENMSTSSFVELIKRSRTVHLIVRNLPPNARRIPSDDKQRSSTKSPADRDEKKKPALFRALSRLTNRPSQENR